MKKLNLMFILIFLLVILPFYIYAGGNKETASPEVTLTIENKTGGLITKILVREIDPDDNSNYTLIPNNIDKIDNGASKEVKLEQGKLYNIALISNVNNAETTYVKDRLSWVTDRAYISFAYSDMVDRPILDSPTINALALGIIGSVIAAALGAVIIFIFKKLFGRKSRTRRPKPPKADKKKSKIRKAIEKRKK